MAAFSPGSADRADPGCEKSGPGDEVYLVNHRKGTKMF